MNPNPNPNLDDDRLPIEVNLLSVCCGAFKISDDDLCQTCGNHTSFEPSHIDN